MEKHQIGELKYALIGKSGKLSDEIKKEGIILSKNLIYNLSFEFKVLA